MDSYSPFRCGTLYADKAYIDEAGFPLNELGKVAPYRVYNLNKNTGFINLGTSHGTGEFAVESIRR